MIESQQLARRIKPAAIALAERVAECAACARDMAAVIEELSAPQDLRLATGGSQLAGITAEERDRFVVAIISVRNEIRSRSLSGQLWTDAAEQTRLLRWITRTLEEAVGGVFRH